jgi:elongation factor Ts
VAEISAAQVKVLREQTGAGMMDCKKALVEAGGDTNRAQDILRERGIVKAIGKAGRATQEGRIAVRVSEDGRTGVLLEVNCETDFVAKTDNFGALVDELIALVLSEEPAGPDVLLAVPLGGGTVKDRVTEVVAKLGENVQVRRLARVETGEKGFVGSYLHAGGKIGSLVAVEAEDPSSEDVRTFARNVCMHVTALQPLAVSRDDLPADEVEHERAVLAKQAESEGKPPNVVEKMVEGRLRKYYGEVVLLEQGLVMDPEKSVESVAKAIGARIVAFRRFQLGEETDA